MKKTRNKVVFAILLALSLTALSPQIRALGASSQASPQLIRQIGLRQPPIFTAFSHDGKLVAIVRSANGPAFRSSGIIDVWDLKSRRLIHSEALRAFVLAFAPDDRTLIAAGVHDGVQTICTYDLKTWKCLSAIPKSGFIKAFRFSPDGHTLAVIAQSDIMLCDYRTGRRLHSIMRHIDTVSDQIVVFSPDGSILATSFGRMFGGREVELWSVQSGLLNNNTLSLKDDLRKLVFSVDGKQIATIESTMTQFWNVATCKPAAPEIIANVPEVAGSGIVDVDPDASLPKAPDRSSIMGEGNSLNVSVDDGEKILLAHSDIVTPNGIAFSVDGKTLYQVGKFALSNAPVQPHTSTFSASDGRTVYQSSSSSSDPPANETQGKANDTSGQVIEWDLRTGQMTGQLLAGASAFVSVQPDAKGDRLLIQDERGALWIEDIETKKIRCVLREDPSSSSTQAAISPDGVSIAVSHTHKKANLPPLTFENRYLPRDEADLQIVSVNDGRILKQLHIAARICDSLAFSPDSATLISHSEQPCEAVFWDVATGEVRRTIPTGKSANRVDISPETGLIVADTTIWNVAVREPSKPVQGGDDTYWELKFAAKSTLLAGSSSSGDVGIWNVADGRRQCLFSELIDDNLPAIVSPDGRSLAVLNDYGAIDIYDIARRRIRATLQAFGDSSLPARTVHWLAFTPDGYFSGSPGAEHYLSWQVDGTPIVDKDILTGFYNPAAIRAALTGRNRPAPRLQKSLTMARPTHTVQASAVVPAQRPPVAIAGELWPADAGIPLETPPNGGDVDARNLSSLLSDNRMYFNDDVRKKIGSAITAAIAAGADPNTQGGWGLSPLMFFSEFGDTAQVKALLPRHVQLDLGNEHNSTALILAATEGHGDIVDLLIEAGADFKDLKGHSLLHPRADRAALTAEMLNLFQTYYDSWTDSDAGGYDGEGRVFLLVKLGADPNVKGPRGRPVMFHMSRQRTIAALRSLGADIDARDDVGYTPLMRAEASGRWSIARNLLEQGANPNATAPDDTPLAIAAGSTNGLECVNWLLDHGADPNSARHTLKDNRTALITAAECHNLSTVKVLVAHGANVNASDRGNSVLGSAVNNNDFEMVRFLLEKGANPDFKNEDGKSLIQVAKENDPIDEFGIVAALAAANRKK